MLRRAIQSAVLVMLLLLTQVAPAAMPCCMALTVTESAPAPQHAETQANGMQGMQHCHEASMQTAAMPEAAVAGAMPAVCQGTTCALQRTAPAVADEATATASPLAAAPMVAANSVNLPAVVAVAVPLDIRPQTFPGKSPVPLRI